MSVDTAAFKLHLLIYWNRNQEHLSENNRQRYSRLCKLLLKQEKINPRHRKEAIQILGSEEAQESYFIEYEMIEELEELYATQQRYLALFDLHVRLGRLQMALSVPFDQSYAAKLSETQVLRVLDYVWASRFYKQSDSPNNASQVTLSEALMSDVIRSRIGQWELGHNILASQTSQGPSPNTLPGQIQHPDIKQFISLRVSL